MTSLAGILLFEPLAAAALLLAAAGMALLAPDSPLPLVPTGLLCGAFLRGLLPVNVGMLAPGAHRWQRASGIGLPSAIEWSCMAAALTATVTAASLSNPDIRWAFAWVATSLLSFRFAVSLPLWQRR